MFEPKISLVSLFVENSAKSADFYSSLFNIEPMQKSPTFVLFVLNNGVALGLWSRYTAEPAVAALPGSFELSFEVDDVNKVYEIWGSRGVTIMQKPTEMDFGRSFVALDPDGHRIRIYKIRKAS